MMSLLTHACAAGTSAVISATNPIPIAAAGCACHTNANERGTLRMATLICCNRSRSVKFFFDSSGGIRRIRMIELYRQESEIGGQESVMSNE